VQTCIVHPLRHGLDFVSWKDRKPVAAALKGIYKAIDAEAGEAALSAFEASFWGQQTGDRPKLAARLERGRPVLCLPR
jgi:putative transposase